MGIKSFNRERKKGEVLLFLGIMLFSTYMGIAEPASLPIFPLIRVVDFFFEPIGRWIEHILEV